MFSMFSSGAAIGVESSGGLAAIGGAGGGVWGGAGEGEGV
jgi:hypothetical protein